MVQFEWEGNTTWDHAMIIVERLEDPYDPYDPTFYVAGHSSDLDDYPLNSIVYESRRFIRIERIDGYAKVYLPLAIKNSGGRASDQPNPTYPNPYPAPMEKIDEPETIAPYPAP